MKGSARILSLILRSLLPTFWGVGWSFAAALADSTARLYQDRVGGRVSTFKHGQHVAELGAMVITGLGNGNPMYTLSRQTNMKLSAIRPACPIYDDEGRRVPRVEDHAWETAVSSLCFSLLSRGSESWGYFGAERDEMH